MSSVKKQSPAKTTSKKVNKAVTKKTPAQPVQQGDMNRTLQTKKYRSFRLSKSIKHTTPKVPSGRSLVAKSANLLWRNKKTIGGILVVYALVQLVLVRGLIASDFTSISELVKGSLGPGWAEFVGSVALLGYLVGAGGQGIPAEGSVYLSILFVIGTLAIIWALRHMYADKTIRIRDAYYKGMYPFIPFILITFVALLQLIPLLFGSWLYQVIIVNGLAVTVIEQLFWLILVGFLALLSFYMLMSTVIAFYVVTLPDMEPMKALRSAKGLVQHRRLQIFWRILFLIIVVFVTLAVVLVPVIMIIPGLAPWLFYVLSVASLAFIHAYMYGLYRELLRES